ncbi:MAG TPA: hypothetical protein ENK28_03450 [Aliiroseovarius sp.]|nr:hypothetical protein [Aliiroseovarius sp.]
MTIRPIIMSASMVRAVMKGRKNTATPRCNRINDNVGSPRMAGNDRCVKMIRKRRRSINGPQRPLAHRPLAEIIPHVPAENDHLGHGLPNNRKQRTYAYTKGNILSGYCDGEISVWLARLDATTHAEVYLAWRLEIVLAKAFMRLENEVLG